MDHDYVFACAYCGQLVDVGRAEAYYRPQRELPDGRMLVTTGTYCGPYCGSSHAAAAVAAGGSG